ncbi:MAG: tyrosine--tRNA ligase [Phycisphaerales bacterium]|nr:tyrosine--tRNA ligase [Phycisphaerales bacterium]MBT7170303.1 tyrosine--tRNA ligase [Phycisphaerales bacterium]
MAFLDDLNARGFVEAVTHDDLGAKLEAGPMTLYSGYDPTADSLHLGHLVPIMLMAHFQRAGHTAIALVGGATGMVGDPSGRSEERNLITLEEVQHNVDGIKAQLSRFLRFEGDNAALLLNNHDWIGPMSFIDYLRDVGKFFSVGAMVAKDSVKKRMAGESGISFTEFSYQTMQAYDFLHLFREYGCTLQCGGNDQWGNITAGTELIRKATGERSQAYGLTVPLMTTASGQKFGKSAGNAVWLDITRTSGYQFYQYWIRAEDADVEKFLRFFTFLSLDEIAAIMAEHNEAPHQRSAQKRLAEEATRMVHSQDVLDRAIAASAALFGGDLDGLDKQTLLDAFAEVPSCELPASLFDGEGTPLVDVIAESGLVKSRGDAKRALKENSIYVNNAKPAGGMATSADLLHGSLLVLRRGKKNYMLVQVV